MALADKQPSELAGARRCRRRAPITYQPACKPGFVGREAFTSRVTTIPLGRRLPGASSNLPGRPDPDIDPGLAPVPSLFGLAPGGVCRAACVATGAVRSYRTLSPLPRQYATRRGGLLSVALSLKPHPAGRPRRTLSGTVYPWSPDFPPRPPFGIGAERPSGRLTDIGMGTQRRSVKALGRDANCTSDHECLRSGRIARLRSPVHREGRGGLLRGLY